MSFRWKIHRGSISGKLCGFPVDFLRSPLNIIFLTRSRQFSMAPSNTSSILETIPGTVQLVDENGFLRGPHAKEDRAIVLILAPTVGGEKRRICHMAEVRTFTF